MPRLQIGRCIVPSYSVIDSDSERKHYKLRMYETWTRKKVKRSCGECMFPGCNPVSISRVCVESLRGSSYVMALKSDGVRYALFLTLRADGSPIALMVDRSWNMYEVEVLAPEAFFARETILEGELVWKQPDETQLIFLVFDAIVVKGEHLCAHPFERRFAEAHKCTYLSNELTVLGADDLEQRVLESGAIAMVHYDPPISMRPKCFVQVSHATGLWSSRTDLDHRVDGVILARQHSAYTLGTAYDKSSLKWKPHSTIDLHGPDDRLLMQNDEPVPPKISELHVVVDPSVVPCMGLREFLVTIDATHVRLFAIRLRTDKAHANSRKVVEATIQDVIDNVTLNDIASASSDLADRA